MAVTLLKLILTFLAAATLGYILAPSSQERGLRSHEVSPSGRKVPQPPLTFAQQLHEAPPNDRQAIIKDWAETAPNEALEAAIEGNHYSLILNALVALAVESPEDATQWMLDQLKTRPDHVTASGLYLGRIVPDVLFNVVAALPEKNVHRGQLLENMAKDLFPRNDMQNADKYLAWCQNHFQGIERQTVLRGLAESLYGEVEMLDVIELMTRSRVRDDKIYNAIESLKESHASVVASWLDSDPERMRGFYLDNAVEQFWWEWFHDDPDGAIEHVHTLSPESGHWKSIEHFRKHASAVGDEDQRAVVARLPERPK